MSHCRIKHRKHLRSWLLLLLPPQCRKTNTRDLDNLETDTGDISLGLALTTETSEQDLVVLVDEVQATIVGDCNGLLVFCHIVAPFRCSSVDNVAKCKHTESCDLLSVLDQLDPDTLSDSGVGLLGLNTDLLEDNALGVRGATEWRGLESGSESALLIRQIGPSLLAAMVLELASGVKSTRLSFTHDCCTNLC
jgi:hypothetical protein